MLVIHTKKLTMRQLKIYIFLILTSIFCINTTLYAQKNIQRNLNWSIFEVSNSDVKTSRKVESFDGAAFDYRFKDLSIYTEKFNGSFGNFKIINPVYQNCNLNFSKSQLELISESINIEVQPVFERKKNQTVISFLPYRKNGNKVEKLVSFELSMNPESSRSSSTSNRVYAPHSVLRSGAWYKIGIPNSGMYKIGFNELKTLGIDPNQIDPRRIRLYGNGGGILPEQNSIFRYDDLQENAIIVSGEDDGVFNQNDYILFYASGPNVISYDNNNKILLNTNNPYSTESNYFLNFDLGIGKRMNLQTSSNTTPTDIVSDYNFFEVYEKNNSTGVNATIKSGRERFGEEFNNQTSYDFNFTIPDIITTKSLKLRADLIGRVQEPNASTYQIKYNGQTVSTLTCFGVPFSYDAIYGNTVTTGYLGLIPSENINININYNKPDVTAIGYLNFIWLNAYRKLKLNGNQTAFRNLDSFGPNKITQFNFETTDVNNTFILDVTDKINVKKQQTNVNGNKLSFTVPTGELKEFHAFTGTDFSAPRLIGKIDNQDLHALGQFDFVIITHPDFKSEAERLAEFRTANSGLRTLVITPDKIYNEFSSGTQDASAIRDFMKMLYDRAGTNENEMPKYLLMFGDGSYDNIDVVKPNTNYLVTYESRNSVAPFGSYVSDDYFGLLDDVEGDWDLQLRPTFGATALDVAVGRLPIQSPLQAKQMVDKLIHYSDPETFGDWRNKYVMIADDQDDNLHLEHAESHIKLINNRNKNFNIDKIYLDSYQQISTPAGNRFPEVNASFNQRVNTGALVINYIGHGGENGLGHEKILTIEDINSWKGLNNMPVLLTATCSFSRWDDPLFQSAGELCLLNPNGGAIALYTTTRIVFANENKSINEAFVKSLFDSTSLEPSNTLGDILSKSKNYNGLGLNTNQRNFTLLGDPSLPFAIPRYKVMTESINNKPVDTANSDTIKALNTVTIKGYVTDRNGNILNNQNGTVYPAVYDKTTAQKTLGQDRDSRVTSYDVRKSIIYKGKASVQNGRFSFTFVVPKDISYNIGFGRLSYYAKVGNVDANGSYDSIIVGGSSNNNISDVIGPQMNVFLNNENFVTGGITGDRPVLIVKMSDENGINTVGNGIGHNITATLTTNGVTKKIDLNEYYESTLDSYQNGEIKYPMSKLEPGKYKLTIKAWDVVNNSSEKSIEFTVIESSAFTIDKIYNYPNPFTTSTGFQFEHNRAGDNLKVMVQIFSVSGKLVKTINQEIVATGSRVSNIMWDGKDEYGDKLAKGVYVYRMKIKASDGSIADKYQKLVIL